MMKQNPVCDAATRHIIDACVQFAKSKGYSDACGVLRGTLFLADGPLSLDDLAEKTGYSKSTVCLNMNLLENLGIAKRIVVPGDKRSRYAIVTDPNSMKASLLTNIKREVQLLLNAFDLTENDLKTKGVDAEIIQARVTTIKQFYKQIDQILDLIDKFTIEELVDLLDNASSKC
jgi:DNA-binding transcriptional regulator GbsR (MarR family)